jgi:hypothetical protein
MAERRGPSLIFDRDERILKRLARGEHLEFGVAYEFPVVHRLTENFLDRRISIRGLILPLSDSEDEGISLSGTKRVEALTTILGSNAKLLEMSPWELAHPTNPNQPTEGYSVVMNAGAFVLNADTAIPGVRFTLEATTFLNQPEVMKITQYLSGEQEESSQPTGISQSEA